MRHWALLGFYLLATVQFVGAYHFLEYQYVKPELYETGVERLPFQTRLLMAPLLRWAHNSAFMKVRAEHLARNHYFFPVGMSAEEIVLFFLNIVCVLIAGWVAVQFYRAATKRNLLGPAVYPVFLALCVSSYILHTVQNFRFLYDMPSLAFFALGLYLIYFRKSTILLVALFAVATLNRETTLLLIPFYIAAQMVEGDRVRWRKAITPGTLVVVFALAAYWVAWHVMIFHAFRFNRSEYYPRVPFNIQCMTRLRYWPQLASGCGFLVPFLALFWKNIRDSTMRLWLLVVPVWYGFMFFWGILVETRIFGELLPFLACAATLIAEEGIAHRLQNQQLEELASRPDERPAMAQAA